MATRASERRLLTAEELLALPSDMRCELVRGELREMTPPGGEHGVIALEIAAHIHGYRQQHGGVGIGEAGFVIDRNPDTVRAPDVAYIGPERAATLELSESYIPGPPDLAVEIVSPNVHEKALAWIDAGCQVVLVVDPAGRRLTRYRARDDVAVLAGDQRVECAPAMPGFRPTVAQLMG